MFFKYLKFFIILALLLCLKISTAKSDERPSCLECYLNGIEPTWSQEFIMMVHVPTFEGVGLPDCEAEVHYRIRSFNDCNGYYVREVEILYFRYLGCDATKWQNGDPISQQLFVGIEEGIINKIEAMFNWEQDGENDHVRIKRNKCWNFDSYCNCYRPCNILIRDCCTDDYVLSEECDCVKYVSTISLPSPDCTSNSVCKSTCSWTVPVGYRMTEQDTFQKRSINYNLNENNKSICKIIPQPASNIVEFHLFSFIEGSVKICIFNTLGIKISSIEDNKLPKNQIIKLNVSNFENGAYFYHVFVNNEEFASGSFLIIH